MDISISWVIHLTKYVNGLGTGTTFFRILPMDIFHIIIFRKVLLAFHNGMLHKRIRESNDYILSVKGVCFFSFA